MRNSVLLYLIIILFLNQDCFSSYNHAFIQHQRTVNQHRKRGFLCSSIDRLVGIIKDTVYINRNLFSLDSIKILTAFTPLYLFSRMGDSHIQKNFYDGMCHKNIRQLPSWVCRGVADAAITEVILFSSFSLFARNEELKVTSKEYALGALSGLFVKDIIKQMKSNANLRPWHEQFSCKQRSHGGFPSGHMFEAVYTATVYGMRYGYRAWVPLGLFATTTFLVSINCNRHYVSQIVAGAALGVMYGVAVHTTINQKLSKNVSIAFNMDTHGNPALKLAYHF